MTDVLTRSQSGQAPAVAANAVVVASGKGGVGKTWLAISIAHAWAKRGRKVLLVDGDLGLANIDIQLGVNPVHDLMAVVAGRLPLAAAIVPVAATGFDLIAGQSGSGSLATAPADAIVKLRNDLVIQARRYDRVVVDLAAGLDRQVRTLAGTGATLAVVATGEPTSLTDAYALIKLMTQSGEPARPVIVVNMARSEVDGRRTYDTLRTVCETYLKFSPELAGIVRQDDRVPAAIRAQVPLLDRYPNTRAAQDVMAVAEHLARDR